MDDPTEFRSHRPTADDHGGILQDGGGQEPCLSRKDLEGWDELPDLQDLHGYQG